MLGHPTHPSKHPAREVWCRRGGLGHSNSGTRTAKVGKTAKRVLVYVPPSLVPRWALKYLA